MIHFYPMSRYIIYIFIVKCSSVIGLKQYKTSKYLSSDNSRHHRETSRDSFEIINFLSHPFSSNLTQNRHTQTPFITLSPLQNRYTHNTTCPQLHTHAYAQCCHPWICG